METRPIRGCSSERCRPRRQYCFYSLHLYYCSFPRKSDDMMHEPIPSFHLPMSSLCRWTPTQPSQHCKTTRMWPCMSYMRLICCLMGNMLFSRSCRGHRFKRSSELTFSFFSLFPLLTEKHSLFTLPTYFTATPPPPTPHRRRLTLLLC